jgi:hypothetical protein
VRQPLEMALQRELFDAFLKHSRCRRCSRKLHPDRMQRFQTRQAGLCFSCLREFNRSLVSLESFVLRRN